MNPDDGRTHPLHEPAGAAALDLRPLSREEVRAIDTRAAEAFGVPTLLLMENAGRGAAAVLAARLEPPATSRHPTEPRPAPARPEVAILCGPGNNGGDGGVVARHLDLWGFAVRVVWFAAADALRGDAAVQYRILERAGFDQQAWPGDVEPERLDDLLRGTDWIVDGLLGTGLTRPVEGTLRAVVEAVNRSGKPVLALDLPSGLDADRGEPLGVAVRARVTATFVARKRGFEVEGADAFTGEVVVVDIGAPRVLVEQFRRDHEPA